MTPDELRVCATCMNSLAKARRHQENGYDDLADDVDAEDDDDDDEDEVDKRHIPPASPERIDSGIVPDIGP